jgi:hypothetical protein
MDDSRFGSHRAPGGNVCFDLLDSGAIQHNSNTGFWIVLKDQDDRSPEVRVAKLGRGHQQMSAQVIAHSSIVPQHSPVRCHLRVVTGRPQTPH